MKGIIKNCVGEGAARVSKFFRTDHDAAALAFDDRDAGNVTRSYSVAEIVFMSCLERRCSGAYRGVLESHCWRQNSDTDRKVRSLQKDEHKANALLASEGRQKEKTGKGSDCCLNV